ncbi:MAG TPA: hypothetical protein VFY74_02590 [Methyloceanibacter sp.]|jgi:hypothetical protein|nr:hypothetical protein [Methyloceanibacter sp.]
MGNLREVILLVATVCVSVMNANASRAEGDYWDPEARAKIKTVDDALALLVPELRKNLPMKVDEITTWLAIQALGPAVLYTYSFDLPKQDIEAIAGDLKNVTTQNACNNKTWRMFLDAGARQRHLYVDESGLHAVQFDIDSNSCK